MFNVTAHIFFISSTLRIFNMSGEKKNSDTQEAVQSSEEFAPAGWKRVNILLFCQSGYDLHFLSAEGKFLQFFIVSESVREQDLESNHDQLKRIEEVNSYSETATARYEFPTHKKLRVEFKAEVGKTKSLNLATVNFRVKDFISGTRLVYNLHGEEVNEPGMQLIEVEVFGSHRIEKFKGVPTVAPQTMELIFE